MPYDEKEERTYEGENVLACLFMVFFGVNGWGVVGVSKKIRIHLNRIKPYSIG